VVPGDEEVTADVADDEFAAHFNREQPPSLLVTTSRKPSAEMFAFLSNLFETLPNATYYARRAFQARAQR
jgi:ribosome production factor 1